MKVFIFLIISFNIFAKTQYKTPEVEYKKAVELWKTGKNKKAFDIFERNSRVNHPPSMFYVGLYHLYGFNTVEISYDTAFYFINEAAKRGFLKAELQRIILYYYGIGIPKDREIAKHKFSDIYPYFKLMDKETKSFLLILIKLKVLPKKQKRKYIKKLMKDAISAKTRLSRINLVFFYRTFRYYIYQNPAKVRRLIKSEIKKGNAEAQALLYEEFHRRMRKSEVLSYVFKAAKQGDSTSQYNLYLYYSRKHNRKKMIFWLRKAAKNGSEYAKKKLRYMKDFTTE